MWLTASDPIFLKKLPCDLNGQNGLVDVYSPWFKKIN
jgi:hypothetical protein